MDCFHDFCLACDKQSNGPYCSQTCRLADLERASNSTPTTPISPSAPTHSRLSWASTTSASSSAYVLSPAYNFTDKAGPQSPTHDYQPQTSYFMKSPAQASCDQPESSSRRSITPSSSRSSLTSTTSDASSTANGGLSEQARQELQGYFSSFSQAKSAKRRPSLR